MKSLRITLAALSLSAVSSLALAAGNPLSVHVLNLENGLPSPGVNVTLEKHVGKDWQPLAQGVSVTDACISMAQTVPVLEGLAAAVRARRQKA
mgnify:CR=1 FL=1